jgi:hypothetical protein
MPEDHDLPDLVPVFRGIGTDGYEGGYSWTLDRGIANGFARRLAGDSPRVLIGTVPRDAVLAYLIERDEAEIIVRPEDVTVSATEAL